MDNKALRIWVHGALLAIGSVLLFLGGPDYHSSRSFRHFWDIGHIVYFALFANLLARWRFVTRKSVTGQWAVILVVTLLAGATIEFLQQGTARTPDTGDICRDLIGSLLVLVFGSFSRALTPTIWRHCLQAAALALVLAQLWPLTRSLIDEAIAVRQFPLLSGFETPFEIYRWEGNAALSVVSVPAVSQERLLQLALTADRYSGIALKYFDGNWTAFRTLKISIYNPDINPLQITCRIHDLWHEDGNEEYEDRYNRSFPLVQGWNLIEIDLAEVKQSPADRNMDMSRIRGLGIFVVSQTESKVLYLDTVRLFP